MASINKYALAVGFDTEWVSADKMPGLPGGLYSVQCPSCAVKGPSIYCPPTKAQRRPHLCRPPSNVILSYQAAIHGVRTGVRGKGMITTSGPERRNRRYFRSYIEMIVSTAWEIGAIDGNVVIDFGKPVAWFGLPPADALAFAIKLIQAAQKIPKDTYLDD